MPSDESQSRHADNIRITRVLGQITGRPPSQLRQQLRKEEKRRARIIDAPAPLSTTNKSPTSGPNPQDRGFEPKPFQGNPSDKKSDQGLDGAPKTVLKNVVVLDFNDDTFYYHDFYETGKKTAV